MPTFSVEQHDKAKMKTSELIICITSVLLIVLMVSEGSPAQKWRPQGRFGKRTNEINNNPLWMILSSSNNNNDEALTYVTGEKPVRLDNLLCVSIGLKNAYKCTRSES
ncbi:uncharacterized protein LOC106871860 isoform X2 [Octopus bimaculoides]|uniref:Uncharacterized protein n=1 Tax=Octopus bimaculoides TaxID=37653 RepID=A0A0L8IDZ9_OCTBM|nr:uncharacterized protein LOC106871860 isoform X2 [Octopus bimaculoides]|eukprot:XP_014774091.1 PREDICTED: uncharacterized protein LOC106871860 isoform X2 [Octopus bimaculoides]